MAKYKQLCYVCKKNYVPAYWKNKYVICYDCQKKELSTEIEDKKMKKMFDIPEEFYKENSFLRSIKLNYIRYKELSEKQISAFKKTVKTMKAESKKPSK
ncbi:MAG: hypothetical protein CMH62_02670 [Nanoarchaeota archaeon]|nr:hypothetical protein [Nanoarchaeota archaeon]|tara:strand:- start:1590 stop:1886 length:297 start_codon:yes stop_codon:yes gene_type:complete